jgi:hypothetical protein
MERLGIRGDLSPDAYAIWNLIGSNGWTGMHGLKRMEQLRGTVQAYDSIVYSLKPH